MDNNNIEKIKNIIEDYSISEKTIQLPISVKILEKVLKYCEHHHNNPSSSVGKNPENISEFDKKFCDVPPLELCEMVTAAKYLEIEPLFNLICEAISNTIKGKTPQQLRDIL
jgi:S-phase kinase-associated protein 1